jgi:PAS domain S-box-containing protein
MLFSLFNRIAAPHGTCLLWQPDLLWLNAVADAVTGIAYYAIPVSIAFLVISRRDLAFGWIFWLFALFILACGTTHFLDVWVLWYPDYAIQGVFKAFTAIASFVTACLLWRSMPELLTLPTLSQAGRIRNMLDDETVRHEHTVEQLRITQESFRLLVESACDCAIYMLDSAGRVISWNAGAEHIKLYRAQEILGRHFGCFYTLDDQAAGKPARALAIAASQGSYQEEGWRVRKDGTIFAADIIINPMFDRNGEMIGFAKITRDISQRKQAQEDLEQARAALAQSQKMEAVGQLTGGIAHDFNNMLTAILGSLEMLEIRNETFTPATSRMLRVIRHAAERGAELTRRLLAFSRKQALAPVATDLNGLVDGMSELLRRSIGEAIVIETSLIDGLAPAFVDPNQVENALLNLAVNARDAMTQDGRLLIETGYATLTEAHARRNNEVTPGDYVFIAVTDNGSGMDENVLGHAFEPFYTTKEVGRGSGLGLSQVYGFVKQSGGHVELRSKVGVGTTVTMYFPRPSAGVEPEALNRPIAAEALPHGTETVLVVDDDEAVRNFSAEALQHLGYKVLQAATSADALALLKTHKDIRLLFTDLCLPVMNGRELADAATADGRDTKVIFTSAYARSAIVSLGLLDRDEPLLPKPLRVETLAYGLRSTLDAA